MKIKLLDKLEAHWRALLDIRNEIAKHEGELYREAQEAVDKACKLLDEASEALMEAAS